MAKAVEATGQPEAPVGLSWHGLKTSAVFDEDCVAHIGARLLAPNVNYSAEDYLKALQQSGDGQAELAMRRRLAEEAAQLFYATSRPERFDIYNHMSAGELFFIDLDSLLLECFCNRHVDWDFPQTLHVIHLLRKRLHDYKLRGGRFHVVEFDCFRPLWSSSPLKALIREVAVHHLQQIAEPNDFVFARFASWWIDDFKDYTTRYGPEFMVVNDAEQLLPASQEDVGEFSLYLDDAKAEAKAGLRLLANDGQSHDFVFLLRSLTVFLIATRIHVVYSSRQVHKDNAIVAFVIRAHSSKFRPLQDLLPAFQLRWETCVAPPRETYTTPENAAAVVECFSAQVAFSSREVILLLSVRALLREDASPINSTLAKVLFVSLLVQREATVDLRAQSAPLPVTDEFSRFIGSLSQHVFLWTNVLAADQAGLDASLADLFDSKLLLITAKLLRDSDKNPLAELLNTALYAALEKFWAFAASGTRPLLPLGDIPQLQDAPRVPEIPPASGGVDNEAGALADNDWQTRASLVHYDVPPGLDAFEKAKRDLESKSARERSIMIKREQKKINRLAASIAETAASMGNIAFLGRNESACIVDESATEEASKAEPDWKKNIKKKKGQISEAEKIRRQNILSRANAALVRQEQILLDKLRLGEDTEEYAAKCELPYRSLLAERPDTKEARDEENRAWSLFYAFASKNRSEFDFVFEKDSNGVFTALGHVERFIATNQDNADKEAAKSKALSDQLKLLSQLQTSTDSVATLCARSTTPDELKRATAELNRQVTEVGRLKHPKEADPPLTQALQTATASVKAATADALRAGAAALLEYITGKKTAVQGLLSASAAVLAALQVLPDEEREEKEVILRALYLRCFEKHLRFRARVAVVEKEQTRWSAVRGNAQKENRMINEEESESAVRLFLTTHEAYRVVENGRIKVRPVERNKLRKSLQLLDLPAEYLARVDAADREWESETSPFEPLPPLPQSDKPVITESAALFQMNRMGHLFERPRPSETDPRVPFYPDDWQREILDIVDKKGSVVVCAPTSSGKTFISYYCMKNVLRTSNEHVVVYVAPTRALINQAMADVFSRYGSKEYPTERSGMKVYGCLGGAEFVQQPFQCQVLITLPETLESLFLSPKYQQWTKLIKYVIFDEIHSIDNGSNGDVWERLLMMVRCPFVALSATIGETQQLADWLNRVQGRLKAQGVSDQLCNVSIVPSQGKIHRWSDIEKYSYMPQTIRPFRKLRRTHEKRDHTDTALLPVHPMSCVTLEMLQTKFPQDLPFIPRESVELFKAMTKVSVKLRKDFHNVDLVQSISSELRRLDPDKYFGGVLTISQTKARDYETELKAEVMRWGQFSAKQYGTFQVQIPKDAKKTFRKAMTAMVRDLIANFTNEVKDREEALTAKAATVDATATTHSPDTMEFVADSMLHALATLQRQDKLPAIVFSFEEDDCDSLVESVVIALETAEAEYRRTDEFKEYERKIKANKAAMQAEKKTMESYAGKKLEEGEDGKKEVREEGGRVESVDTSRITEVPDILEQFTFASRFNVVSADTMAEIERDMNMVDSDLVVRAYKRGIGIHHAGIKGKLRIHFERLFRLKFLPIIFATQTLALGVHSPCRSVVLAGDHTELNTMQFRQMAGRAGRRGQDWRGHCIFMGVPFRKIQRLMTSDLNVLRGHVQLDCITNLRLQQLKEHVPDLTLKKRQKDEETVDVEAAQNVEECLRQEPLFFLGRRSCAYQAFQAAHAQAFYEFLQHAGLRFQHGPHPVATIAVFVSKALNIYKEAFLGNAAFTFAVLLNHGVFHRMAEGWDTAAANIDCPRNREILRDTLTLLAYLLSIQGERSLPLEIHRSVLSDPKVFPPAWAAKSGTVPHAVVLPGLRALPHRVAAEIDRYNKDVLLHFSRLMARLGAIEREADGKSARPQLPLYVDTEKSLFPKKNGAGKIFELLSATQIRCTARSPFVAIAGVGDVFESAEDMIHSLRSRLFIDLAHLPMIDFGDLGRHDGCQVLINACVLDYAVNRAQVERGKRGRFDLQSFNGLTATTSYHTLNRFITGIDTLMSQIELVGPHSHDEVEDDLQDSFIRTRQGSLLACCAPSCPINDPADNQRYQQKVIRKRVWRCLDCWKLGKEVFLCEQCADEPESRRCVDSTGKVNKGHRMQPYVEDAVATVLVQLAAHCEEWGQELTRQDYYRRLQEEKLARDQNVQSVSLLSRHPQVRIERSEA